MSRYVCHFSCGAPSAVAAKLTLTAHPPPDEVIVLNAFVAEEHPDNRRFLADCELWLGLQITVARDEKYGASAREVWRARRYIMGKNGAPCSKELKRNVLDALCRPDDVHVLGYTADEQDRWDRLIDANNERRLEAPLITANLSKSDCLAIIERSGLTLPMSYRQGYRNPNCICCPQAGEGTWNRWRQDYPDDFEEVARIQDMIGPGSFFFRNRKTGERYGVRDLPPDKGHHIEPDVSCSFFCEMAERKIGKTHTDK